MLLNDDPSRLTHIIEATQEAMSYVEGVDRAAFDANRMLQHSVVRCIEIVGEASARLSPKLRNENHHIPWPDMIGMRNRIVHAYFDIDIEIVWKTITEDLPALLPAIVAISENLKNRKE